MKANHDGMNKQKPNSSNQHQQSPSSSRGASVFIVAVQLDHKGATVPVLYCSTSFETNISKTKQQQGTVVIASTGTANPQA